MLVIVWQKIFCNETKKNDKKQIRYRNDNNECNSKLVSFNAKFTLIDKLWLIAKIWVDKKLNWKTKLQTKKIYYKINTK